MKLLIYSEYFLPDRGGTQTVVSELAHGIQEWSATKSDAEKITITVVTQTPAAAHQDSSFPFRVIRRPPLRDLRRLLRDADVLHLAGPALLPLLLGWRSGKPIVLEHHGFQVACPNGQLFYEPRQLPCPGHYMAARYFECVKCSKKTVGVGRGLKMLLSTPIRRWLSNRVAVNITPTNWLASILGLHRMRTIHHGVSSTSTAPSATPNPRTFAYQGRLVTTKGVGVLIQAARILHNQGCTFRLKIIGDGPELKSLQSQCAGLDGQLEFLGEVPDDRLKEILSDVAAVVMPSLGGEVFGLVALENMLRGKLMIVSDIGSLREIAGETGLVFPPGDAAALAACMRHVLDDPLLAASQGAAACERAMQNFSRENMIQSHISAYLEAVAR